MKRPAAKRADPKVIQDLVADPHNRRTHTARNLDMIAASLQQVGSGRSIVIDEHNEILAGNGVAQAAAAAGLRKLRVVDVDGDTLIAVRRRGLTAKQKRALALYDNRTAELAEWNTEQLALDAQAGLTFLPYFTAEEFAALVPAATEPAPPPAFPSVDETLATDHTCPKCGYEWSGKG